MFHSHLKWSIKARPIYHNWAQCNYQNASPQVINLLIYGYIITSKYRTHNCKWRVNKHVKAEFRFCDSRKVFERYIHAYYEKLTQSNYENHFQMPLKAPKKPLYTYTYGFGYIFTYESNRLQVFWQNGIWVRPNKFARRLAARASHYKLR